VVDKNARRRPRNPSPPVVGPAANRYAQVRVFPGPDTRTGPEIERAVTKRPRTTSVWLRCLLASSLLPGAAIAQASGLDLPETNRHVGANGTTAPVTPAVKAASNGPAPGTQPCEWPDPSAGEADDVVRGLERAPKSKRTDYLEFSQDVEQYLESPEGSITGRSNVKQIIGMLRETGSGDKSTDARMSFDRVALSYQSDSGAASFDSDTDKPFDASNVAGTVYRPLMGRTVELSFDEDGKLEAIRGLGEIEADVAKTADLDAMEQLRFVFSEDFHRMCWVDLQETLYRKGTVKAGDTWKRRVDSKLVPPRTATYLIRIKSVQKLGDGKRVALTYEAKLQRPAGSKAKHTKDGSSIRFGSGKINGTAIYDTARKELVRQSERSDLFLDLILRSPGRATEHYRLINKIRRHYRVTDPTPRLSRRLPRAPGADGSGRASN